jgi:RNA polymerase sigma-70 factor (ECF subfamily)
VGFSQEKLMLEESEQHTAGDEKLIRTTLTGETAAFGALVERHWNMAVALALSRVANVAEAEDIAQESFLKAYTYLHTCKNPGRFVGWLSRIVSQQCSDTLRKKARRSAALGRSGLGTGELIPAFSSNPGLTGQQIHFIRETIGQLPDKFRNLVIMRFVTGLSTKQIAEQLGKRPGTVRVWIHRAYNILRRDLAPLLEEVGS